MAITGFHGLESPFFMEALLTKPKRNNHRNGHHQNHYKR